MVSLNHQSYSKCIGFADLQVDLLLQNLHTVVWSYEIQILGTAHYEISYILIANSDYWSANVLMEPKSLAPQDGWSLKVGTR